MDQYQFIQIVAAYRDGQGIPAQKKMNLLHIVPCMVKQSTKHASATLAGWAGTAPFGVGTARFGIGIALFDVGMAVGSKKRDGGAEEEDTAC